MSERPTSPAATAAAGKNFISPPPGHELDPAARRLLIEYSGIAPQDVDAHVHEIRTKAHAIFPYGIFRSLAFLDPPTTLRDPIFQTLIATRLAASDSTATFLDVGCSLGTTVRYLIAAGVPSSRLYGTDLQPGFLSLGYDLFRDRDENKSGAIFVAGDMLREDDARLDVLTGKIDIVYASAFFHLFERDDQVRAAKRVVSFLRPENPKAMIFGINGGPKIDGWEKYVLDADGWRDMWVEVGESTGTRWRTEMDVESSDKWISARFAVYRA